MDKCKPLRGGEGVGLLHARGRAVQVDPMKPKLKPPGTKRLKVNYDILLSISAFNFILRRYSAEEHNALATEMARYHNPAMQFRLPRDALIRPPTWASNIPGRGLHSSTVQLNLSRFGHTSSCPPVS